MTNGQDIEACPAAGQRRPRTSALQALEAKRRRTRFRLTFESLGDRSGSRNRSRGCYRGERGTGSDPHAADRIIPVEPQRNTPTLGQFFDFRGQASSTTQVGPATGTVMASYNGRQYLADAPLTPHANVQLDVSSPLVGPVIASAWGEF